MLRLAVATVLIAVLAACGERALDATPEGAARELIERMRRVHGEPSDARAAFELLSKRAQQNLSTRAQRYSAASGKTIAPEAMIAPSRFLLRFEPQRYTARLAGHNALVEVRGPLPEHEAQIPCVFEDGGWRIDLVLPSLPPVQLRPGTEAPPPG